jgi:hypothetical protein
VTPVSTPALRQRPAFVLLIAITALLAAGSVLWLTASRAAAPGVAAFPSPGSRLATPNEQIVFRGVPTSQFGPIVVTGSKSGVHSGQVKADSDGDGGSFLPATPFTPGEVVRVTTALDVLGAHNGSFTFTVADPAGRIPYLPLGPAPRARGDVGQFHSEPGLSPALIRVGKPRGLTAPGDIFVAPQQGPIQDGPEIFDPGGQLIWFHTLPDKRFWATDFRVQTYAGKPALTWWQGLPGAGIGIGQDVIFDSSYRQIATVNAANGLKADLHEFQLTPQGTALITAYFPVFWDASKNHASKHEIVLDAVVQEIDVKTGLLLFEWDSLDHVGLGGSFAPPPKKGTNPWDYFHVNSIDQDGDALVISARNASAAYKVDIETGKIIWTLGGKDSSFKMGPGASFADQHDVRVRAANDRFVTIFDDGAGPPPVHKESRGLKLFLDFKHNTATRVAQHLHSPALLSNFEGDLQQLPNNDDFIGWGQRPYFTEYDPHGKMTFDGRFVGANSNYRAYRFPWSGAPATPPKASASGGKKPIAYVSWNGATGVASWRVLGGSSPTAMTTVGTARRNGFETAIRLSSAQTDVAVQALDSSGHVLATSSTVKSN